jgi:predicted DNA-binding antitoxin AbrB/MazE fold protein
MIHRLKAIYQGGVFVPREPCSVPEGSEVELIVQGPAIFPPAVKEPEAQQHLLRVLVERMQQNPLPAGAPRLTREALNERRLYDRSTVCP